MKLEKVTSRDDDTIKRWYDDACGTALALELVGERWALLVVRELMFGPRRFSDLRAGLPGISANVLTQRLAGLIRVGIVERQDAPPPAAGHLYALTPWGHESEPAIQALGRWAARSPLHDPGLPLSAASLMLSFRTMLDGERARGLAMAIGFTLGREAFAARLGEGAITITRAIADAPDVAICSDPVSVASVVYGGRPIADAEAAGVLALSGDRALAERFVTLFPLPAKVGPTGHPLSGEPIDQT